MFNIS